MDNIEFIFSEFYSKRAIPRENVLKYFSQARITEYNETNRGVIFDRKNPRALYHMGDYCDWAEIKRSKADIAVVMDADLMIVDERVRTIIPLVKKFGFCVAASGRFTVGNDIRIGVDSDGKFDETFGMGYAMCNAFIAIDPKDRMVQRLFETAAEMMVKQQTRGPLVLWRAIWETGIYPYILPQQWCVCADMVGIGDEIILHTSDRKVREFYGLDGR